LFIKFQARLLIHDSDVLIHKSLILVHLHIGLDYLIHIARYFRGREIQLHRFLLINRYESKMLIHSFILFFRSKSCNVRSQENVRQLFMPKYGHFVKLLYV